MGTAQHWNDIISKIAFFFLVWILNTSMISRDISKNTYIILYKYRGRANSLVISCEIESNSLWMRLKKKCQPIVCTFWPCVSYFLPYLTTTQRSKKRSKVGQVQLHENRWILYKFLLSSVKCYYFANRIEYLPTLLRGDQLLDYAKYILPFKIVKHVLM